MSPPTDPAAEPMIARDAAYHRAPDTLRTRLRGSLGIAARERRAPALWRALAFSGALAAVGTLAWNLALFHAQPSRDELVTRDVVTAHVRSLLDERHLNDVASTDQHTVKPWFTGKLDYAPPVQDLSSSGFSLTGGRLDVVNGRTVAALTYRHRLHTVNLFAWPSPDAPDAAPRSISRQGYSIVRWTRGGLEYWAVSDVAPADLAALADALNRR